MVISTADIDTFLKAVNDRSHVSGYTHDFYNYPARFSPLFAREVIKTYTNPGDLILDPFMGGGTTLIEANLAERHAIGFDISSLAYFISKVKTTPLSSSDISFVIKWASKTIKNLNCRIVNERPENWIGMGYQRNLSNRRTWPIRKLMEQFIIEIESSRTTLKNRHFLRCALLKTGQWALDSTKEIPSANQFRNKLSEIVNQMCAGAEDYSSVVKKHENEISIIPINKPSVEISSFKKLKHLEAPKLVLTSPPYPGIHVVYHRWQIHGRKETPAPFWIADNLDGHGLTHYTMGGRQQKGLKNYFQNIEDTFTAIAKVCNSETLIIQMLAFSEPEWQLPRYLEAMKAAGLKEELIGEPRIWRDVPNRKWYAQKQGNTASSKEVVLFHRLIS
jgi:hypothetical protein